MRLNSNEIQFIALPTIELYDQLLVSKTIHGELINICFQIYKGCLSMYPYSHYKQIVNSRMRDAIFIFIMHNRSQALNTCGEKSHN